MSKGKNIALWIVTLLLTAMFLYAGGIKIIGVPEAVQNFRRWGFPDWFRMVTGLIEVTGAVLLLLPKARLLGAALLICTMLGAIATHLRAGETSSVATPVILLVMLGFVFWGRRAGARAA